VLKQASFQIILRKVFSFIKLKAEQLKEIPEYFLC
jgi:hypothetical protein